MGDQHHTGEYASKKVLFKQGSIEWEERESWAGVLTLSLGTNEAGTRIAPPVVAKSTDPIRKNPKLQKIMENKLEAMLVAVR